MTWRARQLTYRVRELQPDAEDNTRWYSEVNEITVEEAEDAIADENGTFHHNYTANYTDDNGHAGGKEHLWFPAAVHR